MKTYKVYLNIYDFTPANNYLSCLGLGGYHTGVEINDKQYCYCVISLDDNQSGVIVIQPETAEYQFNRKIYLGQTQMTQQHFILILQQLSQQFTCGKYHIFANNCNHFSQQLVYKILGVSIPRWIFRMTNGLHLLCCCLPSGFVSGRWAIEQMLKNNPNQQFEEYISDVA